MMNKKIIVSIFIIFLAVFISDAWVWTQWNDQKPPLGVLPDYTHQHMNGLIGWWVMNEGTGGQVRDYSKNIIGTLTNMANPSSPTSGWNSGKFGHVLSFDGNNDYVYVAGPTFNDYQGTVCAWINLSAIGSTVYAVGSTDEDGIEKRTIPIRIDGSGYASIYNAPLPGASVVRGTTVLSLNTWYYISALSTGSTYRIYLNGVPESLVVVAGSNDGGWFGDVLDRDNFTISAGIDASPAQYFPGRIDGVRVYDRALTQSEIQSIMLEEFAAFEQLVPSYPVVNVGQVIIIH